MTMSYIFLYYNFSITTYIMVI